MELGSGLMWKGLGRKLQLVVELEGKLFTSQFTQYNLLMDPMYGWTLEAQQKAGIPGRPTDE